jgi:hypothetical protein
MRKNHKNRRATEHFANQKRSDTALRPKPGLKRRQNVKLGRKGGGPCSFFIPSTIRALSALCAMLQK